METWTELDAVTACKALREAGLDVEVGDVRVVLREDRWAVALPGDLMARFPASRTAGERLVAERKVLGLLAKRCSFSAPQVVFESPSGFDIRALVPGLVDPWGLYERTKTDMALARRIGHARHYFDRAAHVHNAARRDALAAGAREMARARRLGP